MSRRKAPENFFPRYGVAHGRAQEPTPGSAVKFWGKSVRKNQPLVPWSNIAGSWTRGGGGGVPPERDSRGCLTSNPSREQAGRRLLGYCCYCGPIRVVPDGALLAHTDNVCCSSAA